MPQPSKIISESSDSVSAPSYRPRASGISRFSKVSRVSTAEAPSHILTSSSGSSPFPSSRSTFGTVPTLSLKAEASPPAGTHASPRNTDQRTPCPMINALANSGYLPRDGRNITASQFRTAMKHVGVGLDVAELIIFGAMQIHNNDISLNVGMREEGEVNEEGEPILNLEDFGVYHGIEHDVSLSRQDRGLGDPVPVHIPSVRQLLRFPKTNRMSLADWGRYRHARYLQSKATNPKLEYPLIHQTLGNFEAGLVAGLLGEGIWYAVPVEYIKALFQEERLPYREGWKPRRTPLLLPELTSLALTIGAYARP